MWIAISLLIASAVCLFGQQVTAGLNNGANIRFTTASEPPSRWAELLGGGVRVPPGNAVNRYVHGPNRTFGYDLEVELLGGGQFRLTFKPLSSWEKINSGGGQPLPPLVALPAYPPPQILRDGETLAVDVMTNPKTGQKIVDRIEVSSRPFTVETQAEEPRDFQLDDVSINLTKPAVFVNGRKVDEWGGAIAGPVVWFSPPGHGRILLTLRPRQGYDFHKAGEIRDDRVVLRLGDDEIEIRTSSPVLGHGLWNVYRLEDLSAGRSTGSGVGFGAAGRVEYVLPRR